MKLSDVVFEFGRSDASVGHQRGTEVSLTIHLFPHVIFHQGADTLKPLFQVNPGLKSLIKDLAASLFQIPLSGGQRLEIIPLHILSHAFKLLNDGI